MALMNEMPIFTYELGSSLQEGFGTMTPYNASLANNGARNPLGSVYFRTSPAQGSATLSSATGYASGLWMKYVLYLDSGKPAVKTGPAPVYWADETFTKVVGTYASGVVASSAASVAGWLLPNSGTVTGIGAGTTLFTAALLDNGGLGSYVWIGLQGFIPSAYLAAGSAGNGVYGSGNFAVSAQAQGAYVSQNAGVIVGTVTSNIGDIIATCPIL